MICLKKKKMYITIQHYAVNFQKFIVIFQLKNYNVQSRRYYNCNTGSNKYALKKIFIIRYNTTLT